MSEADKTQIKEHIVSKLREISADEKFKIDAYFFCGFPGGTPNEKLKKVCDEYLEAIDKAQPNQAVTESLIAELEAVLARPQANEEGALMNNFADIKEVFEYRDYL